jgi:hypothetical protein
MVSGKTMGFCDMQKIGEILHSFGVGLRAEMLKYSTILG